MDLFDVAKSCVRRWYVFIPLLAVVGWISYSSYNAAKPVYYGTAVIGFSSPSSRVDSAAVGEPISRNGLMDFGGASLVANMSALALRQPQVIEQVTRDGGSQGYSARIFDVEGSVQQLPLVKIEVTDPNPIKVERTLDLLVGQAAVALRNLQQQAQVPDERMVSTVVVSPPTTPVAGMPTRTRSTVTMAATGAAAALVLTVVFDLVIRRFQGRRRRGALRKRAPSTEPSTDDPKGPDAAVSSTSDPVRKTVGSGAEHGSSLAR